MEAKMELVRGQRIKLATLTNENIIGVNIEVRGANTPVQFLALLVDSAEKLAGAQHVVCSRQERTPGGGLQCLAGEAQNGRFLLNLPLAEREGSELLICVATQTEWTPAVSITTAITQNNNAVASATLYAGHLQGETALHLLRFYRKDGWRVAFQGTGFQGGIRHLLVQHGLDLNTQPQLQFLLQSQPAPFPLPAPGSQPLGLDYKPWVSARGPGGGTNPEIPRDLVNAVGLIVRNEVDGTTATGTGFFIGPGGLLLTCAHVVANAQKLLFAQYEDKHFRPLRVLASAQDADLALCALVDPCGAPSWFTLTPPGQKSQLGDRIGVLGYPLGAALGAHVTYSEGIINSFRENSSWDLLQFDAGAAPGSSGAPLFDRTTGQVKGVVASGMKHDISAMQINFASSIENLWKLGWLEYVSLFSK
jgi:S1-C subfamily serine protease